jgi:hypothetical protein
MTGIFLGGECVLTFGTRIRRTRVAFAGNSESSKEGDDIVRISWTTAFGHRPKFLCERLRGGVAPNLVRGR